MMGYSIGEVAERSGFSASALRYYETIDLVVPSGRTDAGYRLYDDSALARLDFISRAKQLGCSLDDIRDLVAIWEGERCDPVQRRFHELVTTKIADARLQIDDLAAFTTQLQSAAAHLAEPATDGPCGDDCACIASTQVQTTKPQTLGLGTKPVLAAAGVDESIACTLSPDAVAGRVDQWRVLLAHVSARRVASRGMRLEFDERVDVTELARLVGAEQHCCAFFEFAITVDGRGVALEVGAPDGPASTVLTELFGTTEPV